MTPRTNVARRLGNKFYQIAFPLYRPLYSVFKAYADRGERRLLRCNVSQGDVVVDAGANIGVYSRFLSQCVGPSGMVHSFEPSPDNFARLRAAVATLPNVRTNQLAVSDRTGEQLLYFSSDLNVDHRTYPTEGELRRTLRIQATALDDYFKPGERVDLIKMDIQGYELRALKGAARVMAENDSIKLLLEFWPYGLKQAGDSWHTLIDYLSDRGMQIQQICRSELTSFSPASLSEAPRWYANLFTARN